MEKVAQGLKWSEIQNRLGTELGVRMTYMDVRLLVDDLKLTPKDAEPAKPASAMLSAGGPGPGGARGPAAKSSGTTPAQTQANRRPGGVSVSVDQLARSGALVSGKVTFTDGNTSEWYIDQAGRLGLMPQQAGYRPPASDLQQFQAALDSELSKLGL